MRKKILSRLIVGVLFVVILNTYVCFAATSSIDPDIPVPTNVELSSGAEVTWDIGNTGTSGRGYVYKKFQIQLQKRYAEQNTSGGYTYDWKDYGSIKTVNVDDNSAGSYYANVEINTPGYFIARVRAYTVENLYSDWSIPDYTKSAAFDSASTNITITNGSSVATNYGPGTVYGGTNGMQVYYPYQNYNGASNIIGANGQYITSGYNGISYIYDTNNINNMAYINGGNYVNVGTGPNVNNGYAMTNNQYGPGVGMQVQTGMSNIAISPNSFNLSNANQIVSQAPSQYNNDSVSRQNWSTEIGWHADGGNFYYYLGNGIYLNNQWYLIENNYYRFDQNGYAMLSKWFKDPSNNSWYYLGREGKMMTGWQKIDNIWYYLNPVRGSTYGVMYANCSLKIDGKYYAFNQDGAMIMNNYYNGYYYGSDGARQ